MDKETEAQIGEGTWQEAAGQNPILTHSPLPAPTPFIALTGGKKSYVVAMVATGNEHLTTGSSVC